MGMDREEIDTLIDAKLDAAERILNEAATLLRIKKAEIMPREHVAASRGHLQ